MGQSQKPSATGFTLIELMIVIVIVGVLAAVGIPAYQQYMFKAKFSHVIARVEREKEGIMLNLSDHIEGNQLHCDSIGYETFLMRGIGTNFYGASFSIRSSPVQCRIIAVVGWVDDEAVSYTVDPTYNPVSGAVVWTRPLENDLNNCIDKGWCAAP